MKQDRHIETVTVDWQGIAVTVHYEVRWLNSDIANIAHLQLESAGRVKLPVTNTGYRSHFVPAAEIAEAGGPVAYALAWLDYMAGSAEWKAHVSSAQQLSLF